jgi:hypothetical protein
MLNDTLSFTCSICSECQVVILVGDEAVFAIGKPNVKVFGVPTEDGQESLRDYLKSLGGFGHKTATGLASALFKHQKNYCNALLRNKNMMNEFKDIDVLIGDALYPCSCLVAEKFDIPHVVVTMSQLSTPWHMVFGIYTDPAYVTQVTSALPPNLPRFSDRIKNLVFYFLGRIIVERLVYPAYNELKLEHDIKPQKTIRESLANADMILMQRDFIMDFAMPIPPCKCFDFYHSFRCDDVAEEEIA